MPLVFVGNGDPNVERQMGDQVMQIADSFGSLHLFVQENNTRALEEVFTSIAEILGYLTIYDELTDMRIDQI